MTASPARLGYGKHVLDTTTYAEVTVTNNTAGTLDYDNSTSPPGAFG